MIHGAHDDSTNDTIPPIATIPVLALNAASDFHLAQDTFELLVALHHFDDDESKSTRESIPTREAVVIDNRNHFSIMREFGSGLIKKNDEVKATSEIIPSGETGIAGNVLSKSRNLISTASAYISPYIASESTQEIDETAVYVLKFMGAGVREQQMRL